MWALKVENKNYKNKNYKNKSNYNSWAAYFKKIKKKLYSDKSFDFALHSLLQKKYSFNY